jgi:dihydrofolate synthase/folylpolyglutamate synthase
MVQTTKQRSKSAAAPTKHHSYQEIISILDQQWAPSLKSTQPSKLLQLDKALGSPSSKFKAILVGGTNGKSLTINFTTQLLRHEGFTVGSFYAPHFVAYNERIALNNESINNTAFTETANEVLAAASTLNLNLHAHELLAMMAFYYFAQKKVDVAVLETPHLDAFDPALLCAPIISIITRITQYNSDTASAEIQQAINQVKPLIQKNTWVIAADQNKSTLQTIQTMVEQTHAQWAMPIRKLATLSYPFEQLHGRCAALAERAVQIFVQEIADQQSVIVTQSLLAKTKGLRGRPTLEAKRQADLNPKKTIEQYWQETTTTLAGRFERIEKTKPTVLLDNASNIDAFKNLLLGIRLLHYKQPLKGLVFIIGCENNDMLHIDFYKMIRYFFKKTAGQIVFCPVSADAQYQNSPWAVEQITNDIKHPKVKAKSLKSLTQALEYAQKAVDEEQGLIVITGSRAIIAEYWRITKGIKK